MHVQSCCKVTLRPIHTSNNIGRRRAVCEWTFTEHAECAAFSDFSSAPAWQKYDWRSACMFQVGNATNSRTTATTAEDPTATVMWRFHDSTPAQCTPGIKHGATVGDWAVTWQAPEMCLMLGVTRRRLGFSSMATTRSDYREMNMSGLIPEVPSYQLV